MEKILLGLTIFFFTITGLFYLFLSSFNEESRRHMLMNKIAGVKIEKKTAIPTLKNTYFPTKVIDSMPSATPTPPDIRFMIPLGNIKIDAQNIQLLAAKNFAKDAVPTIIPPKSENALVLFADFEIELKFPANILPGSAENKFIFQNKEYEIKIFSQIGTEAGFLREKFYAEKTGKELYMVMYKIFGQSIIISRETGWWGGGEQIAIVISPDGTSENVVRFFVE